MGRTDDSLHHIDVIDRNDINIIYTFRFVLVIVLNVLWHLDATRGRKRAWDADLQIRHRCQKSILKRHRIPGSLLIVIASDLQ